MIQKDPEKGNDDSNYHYHLFAELALMWKLLTSVLAEKVYAHLSEKNVLMDQHKRCRKDLQGKNDKFLTDKKILKDCKKHQRNLAMV